MRRGKLGPARKFDAALASTAVVSGEADFFEILAGITRQVAQAGEDSLYSVLENVIAAVRSILGPHRSVFLLNYATNQVYCQGLPESAATEEAYSWRNVGETPLYLENLKSDSLLEVGLNRIPAKDGHFFIVLPLYVGSWQVGLLGATGLLPCDVSGEEERLLAALADQAAIIVERLERQQESFEISQALSEVFLASRSLSSPQQAANLLKVIAYRACEFSRADFVVLYEYFEERKDVRIPPTTWGKLLKPAILEGRGEATEHGRSAVFHMLRRDEPFYAPQGAEDWRREGLIDPDSDHEQTFFARERVCSSAGFPLQIDNERVGVLFFNYRTEVPFRRRFCERLEIFANQAALALGNARFFQRSEGYEQKLKLLHEIGQELSSTVDSEEEEIFQAIYRQTCKLIETSNFLLCRYDEDSEELSLPVAHDEADDDKYEALLKNIRKGFLAYVCKTRKPLFARQDELLGLIAEGKAEWVGTPAKVWFGVPLMARGHVLGAIAIQSYKSEDEFDKEDQELLAAVAAQAAICIDNHRLLREAKHQVGELSALLDLSQAIGAGRLALTQLLSPVLDRVCWLGECDHSLIFWCGSEGRTDLQILATSAGLRNLQGKWVDSDRGVAGLVIRTGKYEVINDYRSWPEKLSFGELEPLRVCGVPLFLENQVVGAITLGSNHPDKELSEQREGKLLERFAGPVAITIQNALDASFRRALVETGPYAIVAINMSGQVTEFSEAAASLFKYSRDELRGEKVRKLYWDDELEGKKISAQLKDKGRFEGEIFGRSKDEEMIPLFCSAVFLKGPDGENLGSVGFLEDLRIGALRGRTGALVDALGEINQTESLPALLELIVWHAVYLLYAGAGCLFLKEGESFEPKYPVGQDPDVVEELRGQSAQNLLVKLTSSGEKPRPIGALEEVRLSRLSRSAFPYPIHADGHLLGLLWIESPEINYFREDQEILRVVASQAALAIHRAQLREERERTLQGLVVSSNAISVGQIATSFFHEAKNALNVMSLTVDNVIGDIKREPDLKAKGEYVTELTGVLSEMNRLDDLARRLQRFTQQGLRPTKSEVHFNEVVARTQQLLESTLRRKKIKVEERFDPRLDKPVSGKGNPVLIDEAQIQQVLMNILLNAFDASPARGRLTIETHLEDRHVVFRLIDQGHGISEEDRKRIFEPFFTTKGIFGTGLGLYISKLLVEENHQGRIDVSGSPGKGASFSVILPRFDSAGGR